MDHGWTRDHGGDLPSFERYDLLRCPFDAALDLFGDVTLGLGACRDRGEEPTTTQGREGWEGRPKLREHLLDEHDYTVISRSKRGRYKRV